MKYFIYSLIIAALFASCNSVGSSTNSSDTNSDSPPERGEANTDYPPAFEGQTRVDWVTTTTPYEGVLVTKSLTEPWGIVQLPDGRFLITEKAGNMRIVNVETGDMGDEITGLPEVDDRGQGGLLGLTLDPDFAANRLVYWVFSEKVDKGNHTAVAKGRLSDDEKTIENAQVIYQVLPSYDGDKHYGGRIIFDKAGNLFVCTGERSDKEIRDQSQDLNSALGKILHITTDGQPVSGNPFAGQSDALPEIYSYGHRNPQGLAFHPVTGDLWSNEFGPLGGDELNLIKAGINYGWPVITYGLEYNEDPIGNPPIQQKEGMEQPVYYWDPVLSPSGMTFYTGNSIPEWENNLFITGLNSYHIARIVFEDGKVVGEERILPDEDQRFRDITQGKDGALYTVTDKGRLYRIAKK